MKGLAGVKVVSIGGDTRKTMSRKTVMEGRRINEGKCGLKARETGKW